MIKHSFALALLLVVAAACSDLTVPEDRDLGFIVVAGAQVGEDAYEAIPEAVFFRSQSVTFPGASPPIDGCRIFAYSEGDDPVPAPLDNIPAGAAVTMALSGRTSTLTPAIGTQGEVYALRPDPEVPFTPGDTARFIIPGAAGGFPEATAQIRTAEAFSFTPVTVPPATEDLDLSWTPAPAPGSAMAFSLRFSQGNSTEPDQQIYCELVDDGSFSVPNLQLTVFRVAPPESRSVQATRFRGQRILIGDAVLGMLTTFTVAQATAP